MNSVIQIFIFKEISWCVHVFSQIYLLKDLILNGKIILSVFRFWWEADCMFTQQQKAELLKGSMSRIICDNSDIREVPPDSFRYGKYPSDYISCDHIPSMSLEAWGEEKSQGGLGKLLG